MSGRKASIWFWEARQTWAVIINGKRHLLGKEEAEAHRLFAELKEANAMQGDASSVRDVMNTYLAYLKGNASANAHRVSRWAIRSLPPTLLKTDAHALTPRSVSKWIHSKTWSSSTKKGVLGIYLSAFNHAVKEGTLKANALKGIYVPPSRSRGEEAVITPTTYSRLLDATQGDCFQDIMIALKMTGCRPSEACKVKASDFNAEAGTWTLAEHKTAKKTGRKRVIVLPPQLVAICRRLALAHPDGTLFRQRSGKAWNTCTMKHRFQVLSRQLGVKVFAYAFRHSFATERLLNGMTGDMVAALLGNSPAMLHKHYSHLLTDTQRLRNALLRSMGMGEEEEGKQSA